MLLMEQKLEDTVLSLIEPYKNMWYHVYQDNYRNNVKMAKILLKNKVRVCGTIRRNRGLPQPLRTTKLSRGQHEFHLDEHILLQECNNGKKKCKYNLDDTFCTNDRIWKQK